MTKTLLDGPGRVLESVYPRFLVDLAQGDDARLPQAHQQQFRERLMQELLSACAASDMDERRHVKCAA
ncbi:diguanylate cyclase regulator RdcB family protein [Escherichia coli]